MNKYAFSNGRSLCNVSSISYMVAYVKAFERLGIQEKLRKEFEFRIRNDLANS